MKSKSRTAHYALICASYFAAYSSAHAYAAVFLLEKGFSNTMIGIVLALANILSVFLQPISAGLIDKYKAFTNRKVSIFCAFGCLISSVILIYANGAALIFCVYVLLYMLQMLYQPLIQAMNFEYIEKGFKINFGLARGLGSFGYAVASPFVGYFVEKSGVSVLPIINIMIFSIGVVALITFLAPKETEVKEATSEKEIHNSFFAFVKHYPTFMIFILGTTFLFFQHNALGDYLFQIIEPLGGTKATMGTLVMVSASLELPAMAGFMFVRKKIGSRNILVLSAVMFTVKTIIMLFANNIFWAYVSQACQMVAYALFIPGAAYLAQSVMEELDKTKGQAYIITAITLSGVFSSLVCGRLLDVFGVKEMLMVCVALGVIGTIICIVALSKIKTHE